MNFLDPRLPDRFWNKCMPEPNSGCWIWTGGACDLGYGRFSWDGRVTTAYRVSYLTLVGAIPAGLELDHLCRTPSCCNPSHLEPVTHRENTRRGHQGRHHAIKTHCAHGHPFDESNTIDRYRNGVKCRECRACHRVAQRKYEDKLKPAGYRKPDIAGVLARAGSKR